MSVRHLDQLLNPTSVAVLGASNRSGSVGTTVWRNLRSGRFAGPVYAVNPRHAELDGERVYARVSELPQVPDLAIICTPAASVVGIIDQLGASGTRAAIVVTAGLDALQQQAMLDAARPHLLRILGPNCIGLLSPHQGLNASFAHTDALAGDMAFVSQSGALVTAVLDWARSRRIGFSHMVSLGNRADVDFGDLLDFLASDARTRSILLYIESIEAPRKFMSAARAAARNKPVIVVKAGRAGQGVKAAASHTGALAGSDVVWDAAIRRAGMLRVDTLQDLFVAAQALARFRGARHEALTILTNGGGAGVMAADAAAMAGVALAELSGPVRAALDAALPMNWSHANPIDIIGDAPVQRYTAALQALLADPASGTILMLQAPTAIVRSEDIARACAPLARQAAARMMACWLGESAVAEARHVFDDAGIATFDTPEQAVEAFSMLATYRSNQALLSEVPTASEYGPPDAAAARAAIQAALDAGLELLDEVASKAVLQAYGIPTVPTVPVDASADAACTAARGLGFPVVLKIRSPDISHKSDVDGVALNLIDDSAVRQAVGHMLQRVRELRPEAHVEGFTVQPMVQRPQAQELIVGTSIDPMFGPVLLFGEGGTAVEVVADRAIALPPLNRVLARELISRTRVARRLAGYRNRAPAKIDAICDVLIALSQMLADLSELAELDINPLWADAHGVLALDARVRIGRKPCAGADRFAILPYPSQLARTCQWQGQELLVRPIRPEDGALHQAFIERLTPEDVRMRFFFSRRSLPRSEFARLLQIDYAREMAFIALATNAEGKTETVGVVRAVSDPDNIEAEFAIIVRSDLKGQGLGRLLLGTLVDYLRASGTRRVVAEVLRENRSMRDLAHGLGFQQQGTASGEAALRFVLDLNVSADPVDTELP